MPTEVRRLSKRVIIEGLGVPWSGALTELKREIQQFDNCRIERGSHPFVLHLIMDQKHPQREEAIADVMAVLEHKGCVDKVQRVEIHEIDPSTLRFTLPQGFPNGLSLSRLRGTLRHSDVHGERHIIVVVKPKATPEERWQEVVRVWEFLRGIGIVTAREPPKVKTV